MSITKTIPTSRIETYRNPDPRCTYPFEPCGAGYCWSHANHVDGTKGYENMETICPTCECFVPARKDTAPCLPSKK